MLAGEGKYFYVSRLLNWLNETINDAESMQVRIVALASPATTSLLHRHKQGSQDIAQLAELLGSRRYSFPLQVRMCVTHAAFNGSVLLYSG